MAKIINLMETLESRMERLKAVDESLLSREESDKLALAKVRTYNLLKRLNKK